MNSTAEDVSLNVAEATGSRVNPVTAGSLMKEAREKAGLHIAALAVSLKVPVKKLEALEQDRLDSLPDLVFARALASSVCRSLKIDPNEVLNLLPSTIKAPLVEGDTLNAPFRSSEDEQGSGWQGQLRRPVVMAVCLLLTGTLALAFLPDWPRSADPRVLFRGEEVQTPSALKAVPLAPQNAQKDQNSSDSSAQALSNANSSDRSSLQPPAGEIAVSTREKVATGAAVVSTNLVSSTGTPQGHATSPLSFSVTADSWIKVTDAGGAVVLSRLVRGGESVTTGGLLPLAVVVGKADSTKVMVQGRPFDLVPHTRDNVARFEVKS